MFLLDGPRLPPVHASIKMNLKLFRKVKRRMLKRLGILGTKILSVTESLGDEKEKKEMRNTIDIRVTRAAASEKERFDEIKVQMVMRIYRASRARALEILTGRAGEKAAQEAAKEAEEAKRAAAKEEFRRRIAERKKFRANCG